MNQFWPVIGQNTAPIFYNSLGTDRWNICITKIRSIPSLTRLKTNMFCSHQMRLSILSSVLPEEPLDMLRWLESQHSSLKSAPCLTLIHVKSCYQIELYYMLVSLDTIRPKKLISSIKMLNEESCKWLHSQNITTLVNISRT